MSTSHAHRRRSSASARHLTHGLRRRLGFEVMEGRCLLSAATLQFAPLRLPGTEDTTQITLTTVVGGQQAASSPIIEGGYIDLGGLQNQSTNYVLPFAGGAGVGSADVGSAGVTDWLSSDSHTLNFGNSTTFPLTELITSGVGAGMRPVVISPSISVGTPRVDPGSSLTTNQDRGGQEGGIVQIDKILASDERFVSDQIAVSIRADHTPGESNSRERSPVMDARSLSLPADSDEHNRALALAGSTGLTVSLDRPNEHATDLIAPAKDSVVTGELARAMVFELAGGEPAWVSPAISSDKIKSIAPTDSQDAPRADVQSSSPAGAQQAALRYSSGRIRLNGNQVEFPLPPAGSMAWSAAAELRGASRSADGQTANVPGHLAAFNVPNLPVAAVFADLGRGEQPPVRSSLEDDAQTGPLVAGTVIALLILERAAARYKSRNDREILTVVAGPPRI